MIFSMTLYHFKIFEQDDIVLEVGQAHVLAAIEFWLHRFKSEGLCKHIFWLEKKLDR